MAEKISRRHSIVNVKHGSQISRCKKRTAKTNQSTARVRGILKKQLSSNVNNICCEISTSLGCFDEERRHLEDLLWRTVTLGESNSLLIIGPRGCGKSTLVQRVCDKLKLGEENRNVILIKLNGFIVTDDRVALKDITRQLHLENVVGDRVFGSFAENLAFLLQALKCEFDLFCYHKNQTLIYNLFDIVQSSQTPVAVVGITCRLDVIELLEKRVRSRFSHRQLYLFNQYNFTDYMNIVKKLLQLPEDFSDLLQRNQWNEHIEKLLEERGVKSVLRRQFETNKSISNLKKLLVLPVSQINNKQPFLKSSNFIDAQALQTVDTKASMLKGLSILEMILVVSMVHLTVLYEGEPINFEMVYNEYKKFACRKSSLQGIEKNIVFKAFEHLQTLELVKPITGGALRTPKPFRLVRVLMDPIQVHEALQRYPNLPTELEQWASFMLNDIS
ncbi:origin recognition complex subunit 4 isoform X2 [Tachypleus tridentatus]|uniref:origin recognition complex subunit 4 isoform X2 n=1 Tax=Tachypleus tridentatus TaxID=6853 RepID=UPI003FD4221E